jgi:hypothetical protein
VRVKPYDSKGRRNRFWPHRLPQRERIAISPSDIKVFNALHTHGPLPSHYLVEFAGTHKTNALDHFTELYHGTKDGVYFLDKPPEYRTFNNRYESDVYDLDGKGFECIKLSPYIQRGDHADHRLMTACVMASIELACIKQGHTFMSRHQILDDDRATHKQLSLPLTGLNRKELEPDELFGVRYGDKVRFFAVEIDRGGEQKKQTDRSRESQRKTYEGMVAAYAEVFDRRTYHDCWGIPNLRVLFAATDTIDANTVRKFAEAENVASRFHFKVYENFASPWRMPPVYTDMLDGLI